MSTTVSVGRNVKSVPMSTDAWRAFREEVESVVLDATGALYFTGVGLGSGEWGTEDAFTVVGAGLDDDSAYRADGMTDREVLVRELRRIGRYFGQEAVALTTGATVLLWTADTEGE